MIDNDCFVLDLQRDAKLKWYEIIVGQLKKLPHFN